MDKVELLPWGDCKVAFDLDDPDALWAAREAGDLRLPQGWELCETDGAGARWVSVFRVEGVAPTSYDGAAVIMELVRIGALPDDYAFLDDARRILALLSPAPEGVDARELLVLEWRDGTPPHPWDKEWFIALTTYGDRVVLRALPEEYTYDFKTADETYIKRDRIVKWMQFPDSNYVAPALSRPPAEQVTPVPGDERMREALIAAYEAGATDVHEHWAAGNQEREADFGEAARDYADAALTPPPKGQNDG